MTKKPDLSNSIPGQPLGDFVEEYLVKPTFDEDGVQALAGIGKDGKEYGDPVPMAPPIGYNNPPPLSAMIKSMVQRELSDIADREGFDSFEEGDDFEVEDDEFFDRATPYEKHFDPPATDPDAGPQEPAQPAPPPEGPEPNGGGAPGGSPSQPPAPPPVTQDSPKTTT